MTEPLDDETTERLSAWIDGDLDDDARECARLEALVAASPAAREAARALRALRDDAKELAHLAPPPAVWEGLSAQLTPPAAAPAPRVPTVPTVPTVPWWLTALAAGLCFLAGSLWGAREAAPEPGPTTASLPRWLLILHEPEGMLADATPEEVRAVVAEYAGWAGSLAQAGALEAAEKLVDGEGYVLRQGADLAQPVPAGPSIGGYFQVRAADEAAALALARDCPHLGQGGWVELRRIQETRP